MDSTQSFVNDATPSEPVDISPLSYEKSLSTFLVNWTTDFQHLANCRLQEEHSNSNIIFDNIDYSTSFDKQPWYVRHKMQKLLSTPIEDIELFKTYSNAHRVTLEDRLRW